MHIYLRTLLYAGLLLATAAFPAMAQQDQHGHSGQQQVQQPAMGHGRMMGAPMGMHEPAMERAMQHMQQGMSGGMSGDPDIDFARMMIPHHEGAIDMARIELESGKDPQLRQMAQEIIQAQEREIATLKEWLAKHQK